MVFLTALVLSLMATIRVLTCDHTTDAQALINDTASYAELSPSGTGVHIITRGSVTTDGKGKRDHERGIELYDTGRYFTVTGHKLSSPLSRRQTALSRRSIIAS
jgi:putative DNA primase/helicase